MLSSTLHPRSSLAQLPAFPGAEGYGATASGGRGGSVYHVTNLNATGPGSFTDAVSQSHRTVVFDVGGYINLAAEVHLASDLTIAGQTAPGGGIALYGQPVSLSNSTNIIIRYVRFRQGLDSNPHKSTLMMSHSSNIMIDHCSIEWGRWDTVDMGGGTNITLQNCIIGEGISPQRFGCLCQSDNVTFSHNLWISNQSRNPKAKGHVQYLDNIIYNYGIGFVGGHSGADHFDDVINNYFIKGPSSGETFIGEFAATDKIYQSGNYADLDRDGQLNGRLITADEFVNATIVPTPFFQPQFPVTLRHRRKRLPSSRLHRRRVARPRFRGRPPHPRIVLPRPAWPGHLRPRHRRWPRRNCWRHAPKDTDGDGMPDYWEIATGSNPNVADNNKPTSAGTRLEEYLNWLAAPHAVIPKIPPSKSICALHHRLHERQSHLHACQRCQRPSFTSAGCPHRPLHSRALITLAAPVSPSPSPPATIPS